MKLRTRWPWITLLIAAAAVLNPVGLDIIHGAFFSGEQLSHNIWAPIAWIGMAILGMIVVHFSLIAGQFNKEREHKRSAQSTHVA